MCARSFLRRVAQGQVVLRRLLPVVESSRGVHRDNTLARAALGAQAFVAVGDCTADYFLSGGRMRVLTCDQSRRMLES